MERRRFVFSLNCCIGFLYRCTVVIASCILLLVIITRVFFLFLALMVATCNHLQRYILYLLFLFPYINQKGFHFFRTLLPFFLHLSPTDYISCDIQSAAISSIFLYSRFLLQFLTLKLRLFTFRYFGSSLFASPIPLLSMHNRL